MIKGVLWEHQVAGSNPVAPIVIAIDLRDIRIVSQKIRRKFRRYLKKLTKISTEAYFFQAIRGCIPAIWVYIYNNSKGRE